MHMWVVPAGFLAAVDTCSREKLPKEKFCARCCRRKRTNVHSEHHWWLLKVDFIKIFDKFCHKILSYESEPSLLSVVKFNSHIISRCVLN